MDWRTKLAEMVDAYIQGEYEGEGEGDEAYKALKAHILATPFATHPAPAAKSPSVADLSAEYSRGRSDGWDAAIQSAPAAPAWSGDPSTQDFASTHPAPAAPVEFIGLTVRERAEATSKFGHVRSDHMLGIAEAIEEKLRSKNAAIHQTKTKGEKS